LIIITLCFFINTIIAFVYGLSVDGLSSADLLASWCFTPIEEFNRRARMVLKDLQTDVEFMDERILTSVEMGILCNSVYGLITQLRFIGDAFIHQSNNNAVALVNYADTCDMFEKAGNLYSKGICLNNIGNIHYMNKKYDFAVRSYSEAVTIALQLQAYVELINH
jgi:hypothetical protein